MRSVAHRPVSGPFTMTRTLLRTLALGIRQLVVPGACLACRRPLTPEWEDFCPSCRPQFLTDPHVTCPRCSSTVGPHVELTDGCVRCRKESFAFESAMRLGPYEGLLRDLILKMKQTDGEPVAEAVGAAWAEASAELLLELGADVVVPVPLHWWRRWTRGFNQSECLARALASRLQLRCRRWLKRTRYTPKQTAIARSARRDNVRGAFRTARSADVRGKTVLLVDDVLTTGSTAHEAARALRRAAASRVVVAILGHG